MGETVIKNRYFVSRHVTERGNLLWGIVDRHTGKEATKPMLHKFAKAFCKKLNAQENAYAGGYNKRLT